MSYFPSPNDATLPQSTVTFDTTLTFDVGAPTTDRMAELVVNFADIDYDQIMTVSTDVGVTATTNDITTPTAANLVPIFKPSFAPADVFVVGILLTCEFGEAALYFATDATDSDYFDPPGIAGLIPVPLIQGGWLMYVNNHVYEVATNWQSEADVPIFIGEILAATFMPSRITGYVFLKNRTA
jgi:hypothetical protein